MRELQKLAALALTTLAFSIVATGCGDDDDDEKSGGASGTGASGIANSALLISLTPAQQTQLCAWNGTLPASQSATCADGSTASSNISSGEECKATFGTLPASCTASVSDHEACALADPCDLSGCAAIFACAFGGGGTGGAGAGVGTGGAGTVGSAGTTGGLVDCFTCDFQCSDGKMADKCDDFPDCADGADEAACP